MVMVRMLKKSVVFTLLTCFLFVLYSCENNDTNKFEQTSDTLLPKDIAVLNQKIIADPNNSSLYHERGKIYFQNKKYDEAAADVLRAIKADSTTAVYYITLADIYLITNKTRGTKEALEKCIALDSKNTDAIMKLAELLFLVKHYDESLKYIDDALKLDQYNAKAYFIKGMNLLEKGDTNLAISTLQTAVEQKQDYYDAYMQIGLLLADKKDRMAVEYYNNAIRIKPHSTEAFYDKGKFYQDIKDWDNAITTYNLLLAIDSNYKYAHYNLGAIELLTSKKYDKALSHFDKALQSDPQYVEAYYARGTCFEAMGNKKKALENYSLALQINPTYEPALTSASALQKSK